MSNKGDEFFAWVSSTFFGGGEMSKKLQIRDGKFASLFMVTMFGGYIVSTFVDEGSNSGLETECLSTYFAKENDRQKSLMKNSDGHVVNPDELKSFEIKYNEKGFICVPEIVDGEVQIASVRPSDPTPRIE